MLVESVSCELQRMLSYLVHDGFGASFNMCVDDATFTKFVRTLNDGVLGFCQPLVDGLEMDLRTTVAM